MYPTKILEMIFVFAGLMTCVGCFTGIVITALKRKSPAALPSREIEMRLNDIAERLARIENTFEATAIEVERISEAQRFTAKVLAELDALARRVTNRATKRLLPDVV